MRLPLRYPKSFRGLLYLGFALISLPLLFALINNAVSIDRLTSHGRKAVYDAARAMQSTRTLAQSLTGLERTARQYLVLKDPLLLENYDTLRRTFVETLQQFARLPLGAEEHGRLVELIKREESAHVLLAGLKAMPEKDAAAGQRMREAAQELERVFALMALDVSDLSDYSNHLIEREADLLRGMSETAQRILVMQMLALIPAVVFLVAGFTSLILRPVAQLDRSIRQLGEGEFRVPVKVSGPADLEYLGRQLDWLRMRLLELEEQKMRFLRHVSHELKTPLAALREGSDLLSEELVGSLNPEQREIARILRDKSLELRRLIEEMLNFSALRFQRGELHKEPVKMREIIARVAEDQKVAAVARDIPFELDCADLVVAGEPDKLKAIVDNLLSNAVKFSPAGGRVRVQLRRDGDFAQLDVIDHGPGVTRGEREKIFEPFVQGSARASGPVRGTGLGLSIVRENVVLHGGDVIVVDEGTTGGHFRVRLPLAREEADAA